MSTFIISDKHWLCENILCLLSNAVKYSDGGTVEIITELLHAQESQDYSCSLQSATPSPAHQCHHQNQNQGNNNLANPDINSDFVRITITDTGIGVSEPMRNTLFSVSLDVLKTL